MKCPICGKEVNRGGRDFPFCCERCQLLDLYAWFNGEYGFHEPAPELIVDDSGEKPEVFWKNDGEE
jgi:endogenous inhibitor of DNA gyrase (YacG/DUF329 family)